MARKVALLGLVLLFALYGLAAADEGADSSIGNEGSGTTATAPAAATDAVEAPVGGPVPAGAFSTAVGKGFGPAAQGSAASTFHHSALLAAFGLGTIFVTFF